MRRFIRHPTDIPIEIRQAEQARCHGPLRDVSHGGLCFRYPEMAPLGSNLVIRIALTSPPFEAVCRVTWCLADGNAWQVGVEFLEQDILFRLRMVEQICHIEHYRREVYQRQGRALSSQEAAVEWIKRYADSFQLSDDVPVSTRGKPG